MIKQFKLYKCVTLRGYNNPKWIQSCSSNKSKYKKIFNLTVFSKFTAINTIYNDTFWKKK